MKRLLDFLWTHFEDHAMLFTLADASYTASPRWLRIGSRLLIAALMFEIWLWCASFGPVPGAVYPVIVLIGIYLSEFLLISIRHAPTIMDAAGKASADPAFDWQWAKSSVFGGMAFGMTACLLSSLLIEAGFVLWVAALIAVGFTLPLTAVLFLQTPSLWCWLYCLRHHQSWKDE